MAHGAFPLKQCRNTNAGKIPADLPLLACQLIFDSQEVDRHLMIQRYWVSRGDTPAPADRSFQPNN
jgi:hypothetical protein